MDKIKLRRHFPDDPAYNNGVIIDIEDDGWIHIQKLDESITGLHKDCCLGFDPKVGDEVSLWEASMDDAEKYDLPTAAIIISGHDDAIEREWEVP